MAKDGGVVHDSGGQCGWPGNGLQGIAPAVQRSEWAKSTDMATKMWATLQVDGFEPPVHQREGCVLTHRNDLRLEQEKCKSRRESDRVRYTGHGVQGNWVGDEGAYSFVAFLSRMTITTRPYRDGAREEEIECQSTGE